MIRIVAVDDELPALRRVGKLLETFGHVEVCGLFDKPAALLEYVLTEPAVDLALLDMDMPTMHGLELARRLRECRPDIQLAFLTAYEEFARDAFDVDALDYLLKPVMPEDLNRTLDRYRKRRGKVQDETAGPDQQEVAVHGFGPFSVFTGDGAEVRFRNSKAKELLAYLHHHQGKPVLKAQIIEDLWYGRDEERSQTNLHTTVYQLRKDMAAAGLPDPIGQSKLAGGSYCVSWHPFFDDAVAFAEEVSSFRRTSSIAHALKAVQLYGAGYLQGSGYDWAAPKQAELELVQEELLEAIVGQYVRQRRYDIAMGPMRKWAELNPLSARLHGRMIALLLLLGREDDARSYGRLAQQLLDESGERQSLDYAGVAADPLRLFLACEP
ncbi:MAG: response regulator [Paenibacillaceae bacterium]|nr:response regulator [Paenibacillaceae bacterium]